MRDNRPVIESTIDLFHAVMVEISRTKLINKKSVPKRHALFLLTHLVSNQNSSEPKSDVLPITPWVKNGANLAYFFEYAKA